MLYKTEQTWNLSKHKTYQLFSAITELTISSVPSSALNGTVALGPLQPSTAFWTVAFFFSFFFKIGSRNVHLVQTFFFFFHLILVMLFCCSCLLPLYWCGNSSQNKAETTTTTNKQTNKETNIFSRSLYQLLFFSGNISMRWKNPCKI